MLRSFGRYEFSLFGSIEPERRSDGTIMEYMPQARYANAKTTPLNPNGSGPFCRFSIARNIKHPGVYVVTQDGTPVYVGKSANLSERWGSTGYGNISPKNCFKGGQSTSCKVNHNILLGSKADKHLELWFYLTEEISEVERVLIQELTPPWNKNLPW